MAYLLGESVNLGVGGESAAARGTGVTPSQWIPARTPTGIRPVLEKTLLRETRGTGIMSQGSEVVQTRAEGDLEFNLRVQSIGWILQSLLGSSTPVAKSAPNAAVYDHTYSVLLNNPQHPTLTLGLGAPNFQDFEYKGAVVNSLEIRTPVDDLVNATAGFIARSEATHADYTVSFASADTYFRQQDVSIKIANDTSGLAGATPIKLKELSLSINNNARPDMNIGSLSPADVFAMLMEITGSFKIDLQGQTYHDLFTAGTSQALEITFLRSDVTIGSSVNPKMVITLPKITFENLTPDRPLDDVVKEDINFTAHYDATAAKAITVVLTNLITTYNVA
jgi:hypothetical protein